jgi:hypothetical protein
VEFEVRPFEIRTFRLPLGAGQPVETDLLERPLEATASGAQHPPADADAPIDAAGSKVAGAPRGRRASRTP